MSILPCCPNFAAFGEMANIYILFSIWKQFLTYLLYNWQSCWQCHFLIKQRQWLGFLMASYLLSVWNIRLNSHETFSTPGEESLTLFGGIRPGDVAAKPLGHPLSLRGETQHTWNTGDVLRATIWRNFTCFSKVTAEKLDFKSRMPGRKDWNVVLKGVIIFVNGSDMNNAKSWASWEAKFAVLHYFYN